jgi:hypothetical protein
MWRAVSPLLEQPAIPVIEARVGRVGSKFRDGVAECIYVHLAE